MSAVFSNRDSINTKSLEREGWGLKEEKLSSESFPPSQLLSSTLLLKLFLGHERQKASTTRAMVTQNMMAESALMSGFTPSRTIE
ncbi:MAG: hypothetical protein ACLRWP_04155 [Bilophila wadsworthia]